jgi:hypothetical protein
MSSLSEALQEKFGRRSCPFLCDCEVPVTKDYFSRICKTSGYINCHHFAKKMGELNTPITWLQKIAVQETRLLEHGMEFP